MSANSKIEWTDRTWNPVTGCTKVSPGCDHCYAEKFAERWRGVHGHAFENGFDLTLHRDRIDAPRSWKTPQRVFVNSMSDLFHRDVSDEFIEGVYRTMLDTSLCPWRHTFQVLTKRPERMRRIVSRIYAARGADYVDGKAYIDGIWHGVSVESNDYAWRVDMLRETPAAVRFISFEPLLGPVDAVDLAGVQWVILGGESGPGARQMDLDWIRDVRDRARLVGAAVFVKQLGAVWSRESGDGEHSYDRKGGDIERFPADLCIREYPS